MRVFSKSIFLLAVSAALVIGCDGNVQIGDPGGAGGEGGEGGEGGSGGAGGETSSAVPPDCAGTTLVDDGVFFFVIDVKDPIGTQLQLFGDVRVEAGTGAVIGQLTNANRSIGSPGCPLVCDADEACRTIPEPECVLPSTQVDSTDEYPDFVVAAEPPTGYSFTIEGCVEDTKDGMTVLETAPTKLEVESPPVAFLGLELRCSFTVAPDGVLRCDGEMTAMQVSLGSSDAGPSSGPLRGRLIPPGQEPEGLPAPPQ